MNIETLVQKLDSENEIALLDLRNMDDFEASRIDTPGKYSTINAPFSEMKRLYPSNDLAEVAKVFAENELGEILDPKQPVIAVCYKGITSEIVSSSLQSLGYQADGLDGGIEAWNNFYQFRPVHESAEFSLYQVNRPARGCLSYVLISDAQAALIDPLRHGSEYIKFVESKGAKITFVFDTHGHADHISGGPALAEELNVPYYLHPYDAIHPIDVLPAKIAFEPVMGGQTIALGEIKFMVHHIPGHTLGNLALQISDQFLLAGDSLFINSISRPDLGGKGEPWAKLHYASLRKLLNLPDSMLVLPGHSSDLSEVNADGLIASTLDQLKKDNHSLQMVQGDVEKFVQFILDSLPEFPEQYIDIKRINAGLLEVNDLTAVELETGKNICALG